MRARSAIALGLVFSLSLTAVPVSADTKPASQSRPKRKKQIPRKPLRAETSVVGDMAGGLLKSVAGMVLKELLFPSKTIDIEKLLADISVNMRKELVKNVMENDETTLTAAATALQEYERQWQNGSDPTILEDRIERNSTLQKVYEVIARTGAAGKAEYVDPGVPLFLASAQLKANTLELRRKVRPDQDKSIRPDLIAHLEASLDHVRKTMSRRREAAMYARLGKISDCHVSQKRVHGPPWSLTTTYETGFSDSAVQKRMPGSQADDDEGKALARCEGNRQPYVDAVRKARAPEVDKDWVATLAITDTWAKTLDVLKNNQAPSTARAGRIDFGGIFGIGEGGSFNNAVTGGQNCPAGYTPYEIKGTFNVDWPVYYCGRIGGAAEGGSDFGVADFGGLYGKTNDAEPSGARSINNSITGAASCPAGFTAAQVKNAHELYYCWRRHEAGKQPPYLFGGMYSDNGDKKNPITERLLCPNGYEPALVHGTRGGGGVPATRQVIMCWTKTPAL